MFYGIKVRKVRNPLLIFSTLHQNPPEKKYVFSTSFSPAFGSFYVLFPALFLSRSARTILSALVVLFPALFHPCCPVSGGIPPLLSCFRRYSALVVLFPVLFLSRSARTIPSAGSYFVHCAQIEFGHGFALSFLLLRPIESGTASPSSLFPSVAFLPPLDSLYCADCQSAFPLPPFPPPLGGRLA